MKAKLVNRLDGRWHIEVSADQQPDCAPPNYTEENWFEGLQLSKLSARMVGSRLLIEAESDGYKKQAF